MCASLYLSPLPERDRLRRFPSLDLERRRLWRGCDGGGGDADLELRLCRCFRSGEGGAGADGLALQETEG